MQSKAAEPADEIIKSIVQTHSVSLEMDAETQTNRSKTFGVEERRKESQAARHIKGKETENRDSVNSAEFQESINEPQIVGFVGQIVKQNQPRKVSEIRKEITKKANIFLPMSRAKSQMSREASDAPMGDQQTILPLDEARTQESAELREGSIRKAKESANNMPEEEDGPIISDEQFWINMNEEWRAAHTRKEEPQTLPREAPGQSPQKAREPKVNSAIAALRKQYTDIQSKISPAKPVTPRIRWTPNLSIPPPDGPDAPPETRPVESFSTLPKVSAEALRKRKREEKRREKEEQEMDEALDTEVLPKKKRGGKKLNELEESMRVAGMYPEDPDKKTPERKGRGKGRGREEVGKEERPWERKETRGRGIGRG